MLPGLKCKSRRISFFRKGFTLVELLIAILLIPLIGLTMAHLNILTDNFFRQVTLTQQAEQEVEGALGFVGKDMVRARSLTVYSGGWGSGFQVPIGTPGDRMEMTVDDDNDIPSNAANDDMIRYSTSGTTIVRDYMVRPFGGWISQTVARNVSSLSLVQTLDETLTSQNVMKATVGAAVGGRSVQRTRYIASRTLRTAP